MSLIVFIATSWGPKNGGVNAFNMDLCASVGQILNDSWRVVCIVEEEQDSFPNIKSFRDGSVTIIALGVSGKDGGLDGGKQDILRELKRIAPNDPVEWWIGHDYITGGLANTLRDASGMGKSAVVMHTSPIDYVAQKKGNASLAISKYDQQAKIFKAADKTFAVGTYLQGLLSDILRGAAGDTSANLLVPGLAKIKQLRPPSTFSVVTFGRLNPEDELIKQGRLAVSAFGLAVRRACEQPQLHRNLATEPRMLVIGINESGGDEEREIQKLAEDKAGRIVKVLPLAWEENRDKLLDQLAGQSLALMLSWHEGFGLSGWEAIAAGVPLIISKASGLYKFIQKSLGGAGIGCFRPVDIRGSQQPGICSPEDEDMVSGVILQTAAEYEDARRDAGVLRTLLMDKGYTWENTARSLLEALDIRTTALEVGDERISSNRSLELMNRSGIRLRVRGGGIHDSAEPLRSKIYDFAMETANGKCELCHRGYTAPKLYTLLVDDDHDFEGNLVALCGKCAERISECPDPVPILKSMAERIRDRIIRTSPRWFYCERCQSGDLERGLYTDEERDDQYLWVRCSDCGWTESDEI